MFTHQEDQEWSRWTAKRAAIVLVIAASTKSAEAIDRIPIHDDVLDGIVALDAAITRWTDPFELQSTALGWIGNATDPVQTTSPNEGPPTTNVPPVIKRFEVRPGLFGTWHLTGFVQTSDEQTDIVFGGLLAGRATHVRHDGSFRLSTLLHRNETGVVSAQAIDRAGRASEIVELEIH